MKKLGEWLKTSQGVIVAITAVLLVTPALINSAVDVYHVVADLPIGGKERQNALLFKRHFREQPILTTPLFVKTSGGQLSMTIDVYENGDIFARYGRHAQWFPFSADFHAKNSDMISFAYAQGDPEESEPRGRYLQSERFEGRSVVQERIFENKVKQVLRIDRNTGTIIEQRIERVESPTGSPMDKDVVEWGQPIVVDIEALKRAREQATVESVEPPH